MGTGEQLSMNPLHFLFKQSALLYALFLIPTLLLLNHAGLNDRQLSLQIGGTWQAGFWQFPGLTSVGSRVLLDALEAMVIAAMTWLFYRGFQQLNSIQTLSPEDETAIRRTIIHWSLVCGAFLVAVVPFHSSDLYGYLNRGFQQSLLQTNPYLTPIADISGWENQPLLHAHWIYNPCPYGFFFAQLASWATQLSSNTFTGAFILFKFLNLALLTGTTALIYRLSRQLGLKRPWLSAYLFGANPLVLLHVVGNGHNDILMSFLLLASLCTLFSTRWRWSCLPLLALSILTKYASILALPFIGLYLFKLRDYRALLLGCLLSIFLATLLAIPYIDFQQGWPWAALLDNAGKPQHSLIEMIARLVYYPGKWLFGHADTAMNWTLKVIKPIFWLGFAGLYLWQWLRFARQSMSPELLIGRIGLVMTVMIALISAKFHPWYPVMFLPLLLLLPEQSRWRQFGLTFSLFQIGGFTIFQNLPVFSQLALTVLPTWLAFSGKGLFKPASTPQ
jgi:alpha-1,6-mannosyltransferase